MSKRIYFILGACILGVWGAALCETFETFRGIPWGADKKDVPGLIAGPQTQNIEACTRDENKKVGDIDVQTIYYMFYRGKFGAARILVQGASNSSILRETLSQKYGPGEKPTPALEKFIWDLKDLKIIFQYREEDKTGSIDYFFKPIVQQREEDKAKAKERDHQKRIDDL
jgi:hypothetical protein